VILLGKNTESQLPIASLTKLMTAIVTLDAEAHTRRERDHRSRGRGQAAPLAFAPAGRAALTRDELLHLALMASENRAASALGRSYPGGREAIVLAMNLKAQLLGMTGRASPTPPDSSGGNISTAHDLAKLVRAAHEYPKTANIRPRPCIRSRSVAAPCASATPTSSSGVPVGHRPVPRPAISARRERCLVMQVTLADAR